MTRQDNWRAVCNAIPKTIHNPDEVMQYPDPADDHVRSLIVAAYNAMVYVYRVEDLCAKLGVRHGLGRRTGDKLLDVSFKAAKLSGPPDPLADAGTKEVS